uniref:Uncharacterized protein n=1 Tax=Triticum urartu TaxID=4572 RepID=A0A8R7QJQ3_TRIUA
MIRDPPLQEDPEVRAGAGEADVEALLLARVGEAGADGRVEEDDVADPGPRVLEVDEAREALGVPRHVELEGPDLEEEPGERGAAGAAGDPEDERVLPRAALRLDEVVEELGAVRLVHLHVPGLQGEGQRAVEPLDVRDSVPLLPRRRRRVAVAGGDHEEQQQQQLGHAHAHVHLEANQLDSGASVRRSGGS